MLVSPPVELMSVATNDLSTLNLIYFRAPELGLGAERRQRS